MSDSVRDTKYATTSSVQGGLYDVLLALKTHINRNLNVATFAEVQKIDTSTQIVTVKPFPLIDGESEKNIDCFSCMIPNMSNGVSWVSLVDNLAIHDIVLVVFVNRNSSQAFTQLKNKQNITSLSENTDLHSDKYGVIVGLCYKYQ